MADQEPVNNENQSKELPVVTETTTTVQDATPETQIPDVPTDGDNVLATSTSNTSSMESGKEAESMEVDSANDVSTLLTESTPVNAPEMSESVHQENTTEAVQPSSTNEDVPESKDTAVDSKPSQSVTESETASKSSITVVNPQTVPSAISEEDIETDQAGQGASLKENDNSEKVVQDEPTASEVTSKLETESAVIQENEDLSDATSRKQETEPVGIKLKLNLKKPEQSVEKDADNESHEAVGKKHRTTILNIPIIKPKEDLEPSEASPPSGSPTKKSRSAGLDSVVSRLMERQTEPSFSIPGLTASDSPPAQTALSPTRRTPPKVLDEYAKVPSLSVKISPTSIISKQISPKSKSPTQQKSPFKSPLSPSKANLATVQPNFVQPKIAPVTQSTEKLSPKKVPDYGSGGHIISFKEHIDALVTKELISSQESEKDEKMEEDIDVTDDDKSKKKKVKMNKKRGSKSKKETPKPKMAKVELADDNACDVPDFPTDRESSDAAPALEEGGDDEASQDASRSKSKSKTPRKMAACSSLEDLGKTQDDMGNAVFLADNVHEYQWPPDSKEGEWSVIQEQVTEYLGIKSFKRKYPTLFRRPIVMKERNYLQEKGVVTETQCDLGLTALLTEEVLDLMAQDYPTKYKEFTTVLKERQRQRLVEKRKAAELLLTDKNKLAEMRKKAIKSASEYNASFMRERREERRAYLDMQTLEVHWPKGVMKTVPPDATKVGAYPVALIPGQFQDYYKKYRPDELKYLPLNTVSYPAPKRMNTVYVDPNQADDVDTDSDDNISNEYVYRQSSTSDSESQVAPSPAPVPMETNGNLPTVVESKSTSSDGKSKVCKVCQENESKTETGDEMLTCSECNASGHPSCLELTEPMVKLCRTYPWQCMECKTCVECMDPYDEDKMMFCDRCDRGYHTFCLGVRSIPTGRWECPSCKPRDTPKNTPTKKGGRGRKKRDSLAPAPE